MSDRSFDTLVANIAISIKELRRSQREALDAIGDKLRVKDEEIAELKRQNAVLAKQMAVLVYNLEQALGDDTDAP